MECHQLTLGPTPTCVMVAPGLAPRMGHRHPKSRPESDHDGWHLPLLPHFELSVLDLNLSGGDLWTANQILFESVQQRCLWLASAGLAACNHSTPSLVPWTWVRRLVTATCHLSSPPTVLVLGPGLDASPTRHPRRPHWCATALSTINLERNDLRLGLIAWPTRRTMRSAPCAIFELNSSRAPAPASTGIPQQLLLLNLELTHHT